MTTHIRCFKFAVCTLLAFVSFAAEARTLFSGTFVQLSVNVSETKIGINYPAIAPNRLCGLELKSHLMILNRRVWESLASGLRVTSASEFLAEPIAATISVADGPRISYVIPTAQLGTEYVQMTISTMDGRSLVKFFADSLNIPETDASVIAVGLNCGINQ